MTTLEIESKRILFVAAHAGAGNHSKSNEARYKDICKAACKQAMSLLTSGASALDAVTSAVTTLENDECTNAGVGSTLNMQGCVECEACAMDGASRLFGAVGVLSNVKNPICIANKLVKEQMKGPMPLGRVRPSILVGEGARLFCSEHGIDTNHNLTTPSTLRSYGRYKRKCQVAEEKLHAGKRIKLETAEKEPSDNSHPVTDTVGAICIDQDGNVAAGSSSGGIWLKHPGRVGPIAMYGTGCWAQNQSMNTKPGVAIVTSGCGEHLMSTLLAKTLSDGIRLSQNLSQELPEVFQSSFLESEFLARIPERLGAALVFKTLKDADGHELEFCWIHSTSSMCFAFMTGNQKSPKEETENVRTGKPGKKSFRASKPIHRKAVMSRLDDSCVPGHSFTMGGHVLTI